jgi:pyruvate formate lyase activating enzyme
MTEDGYFELTGQRCKETTFNFAKHREQTGKQMWLRYVLIPEITSQPELLHAMGDYFKEYTTIEKIEIQPYHKLGIHKWEALGWDYQLKDARENTPEELEVAASILRQYFKEVKIN